MAEVILALDTPTADDAKSLLKRVGGQLKWVKVGLTLYTRYGRDLVMELSDMGYRVFLDLKMHDIPHQVGGAVKSLQGLDVGLFTLQAPGGSEMIQYAKKARDEVNPNMQLLGITVLTSMDQTGLNSIGVPGTPLEQVLRLGKMGMESGLDGLVSSPIELPELRKSLGDKPLLVTPGIRAASDAMGDQKRVMTAPEAKSLGSNYLVIGRPISQAEDPAGALEGILESMEGERNVTKM